MTIAGWYKIVLGVWAVIGLPSIVLAFGFGEGSIEFPNPETATTVGIILWVVIVLAWSTPMTLAPFGIRFRR